MSLDALAKALEKDGFGNDFSQSAVRFLSTGFPPLDEAISGKLRDGGLPMARMVEMAGPPSSGKTMLATKLMANAQAAGGIAMFQDHENSFERGLAENLGLITSFPKFIYNRPDTYEQSCDQVVDACLKIRDSGAIAPDAPIVVVFDSLASMIPQSKWVKGGSKDYNMNDNTALARCTSANFQVLAQHCERRNVMMLFLNQTRTKLGVMYGDPTSFPGGQAPEFYASVRIKLGRSQIKEDKKVIGQTIGAEIIKNKVNRPFEKAKWDYLFGDGGKGHFDVIGGMLEYCKEVGAIETAGAYLVWGGKKYYKSQLVPILEQRPDEALERLITLAEEAKAKKAAEAKGNAAA